MTMQPLFNGMLAIMLTKFVLNDVPHAAGLYLAPDQEVKKTRLFHISSTSGLLVLYPSMPADDIIEHEFIRAGIHVSELPQKSKSVSFAGNFMVNLKHVPSPGEVGYFYEPVYEKLNQKPRRMYLEITPEMKTDLWADYDDTLEYRFYSPVAVKLVGEVRWEGKGITLRIIWYDGNRQFLRYWDSITEVKNSEEIKAEQSDLPWEGDI